MKCIYWMWAIQARYTASRSSQNLLSLIRFSSICTSMSSFYSDNLHKTAGLHRTVWQTWVSWVSFHEYSQKTNSDLDFTLLARLAGGGDMDIFAENPSSLAPSIFEEIDCHLWPSQLHRNENVWYRISRHLGSLRELPESKSKWNSDRDDIYSDGQ